MIGCQCYKTLHLSSMLDIDLISAQHAWPLVYTSVTFSCGVNYCIQKGCVSLHEVKITHGDPLCWCAPHSVSFCIVYFEIHDRSYRNSGICIKLTNPQFFSWHSVTLPWWFWTTARPCLNKAAFFSFWQHPAKAECSIEGFTLVSAPSAEGQVHRAPLAHSAHSSSSPAAIACGSSLQCHKGIFLYRAPPVFQGI